MPAELSDKDYFIYILTNKSNSILYVGCTHDLYQRLKDHKLKLIENSFSAKYNLNKLIYYEILPDRESAYQREKQIKDWRRSWKDRLINHTNPERHDLTQKLFPDFNLTD